MPLDTSIALGATIPQFSVAPAQVGGPANMLTDVLKLKGLQQDQQLNQLKMQEYQRARAQAAADRAEKVADQQYLLNALRGTVVGPTGPQIPDPAAAANSLLAQGKTDPAIEALKLGEAVTKERKGRSDLAKVDTENLDKQLSTFRTFAPTVNSPEGASVYARAMYDHPVIGPLMQQTGYDKDAAAAKAAQDYAADPQRWMAAHVGLTGQQVVDSLKQTTTNTDLGGQILQQQRDAFGRPIEGGETRLDKTLTPKEGAEKADTSKIAKHWVTDDKGNVTAFNERGEPIATHKGMGAPSGARQKAIMQAETMPKQLDYAISELENAIKKGGDLEAATGSGVGALVDTAAGFAGYATPGSIASARLKPVQDIILKMVPRFEGPQSDRDVVSYRQASGELANEKLPVETRRAAAETIIRLMKARKGQFITSEMASGEVPVQTSAGDDISAADAILAKGKK
jgi:hypothetical protein